MSHPALPSPGDLVAGKYRIERLIGQGGMGAVFAAQHEMLCQRVAVKVLLSDVMNSEEAIGRFLAEARNAAKIRNEYVAAVTDVGTAENGLPYMVIEYLEGLDLSQLLEQGGRLGYDVAVDYVLQAVEAIHQAHSLGIIHRDLKPSNLFLSKKQDGTSIVKVLDFGISKAQNQLGPGASGALTSTKAMLGSPLYMSPEQLRSSKSVDVRADIWALGVILYELLTGTVPYMGENLGELFAAILEQDAPPVRQRAPGVPPELEAVLARCLQRRREDRYSSVAELGLALAPFSPTRAAMLSVIALARAQLPAAQASPYAMTGLPPQGANTGNMARPAAIANTGAGRIPPHMGTVPLGAMTPMPGGPMQAAMPAAMPLGAMGGAPAMNAASTGSAWADTGGSGAAAPRGVGVYIGFGIGVFVLVFAGTVGAYMFTRSRAQAGEHTTSTTTSAVSDMAPAPLVLPDTPIATPPLGVPPPVAPPVWLAGQATPKAPTTASTPPSAKSAQKAPDPPPPEKTADKPPERPPVVVAPPPPPPRFDPMAGGR